jgi:septal ring factor EnvC (AmiA/AmiB activator)
VFESKKIAQQKAKIEEERAELERLKAQLEDEYLKLDQLKFKLETTRRKIEVNREKELIHNHNRERRIAELKEKNAELTSRLCHQFNSAADAWPEGRKKREGKKLNNSLGDLSEGCAAWCITNRHGEPPR